MRRIVYLVLTASIAAGATTATATATATATPSTFTCITLIVDAKTLSGLDIGTGASKAVDLASLGPVTTAV